MAAVCLTQGFFKCQASSALVPVGFKPLGGRGPNSFQPVIIEAVRFMARNESSGFGDPFARDRSEAAIRAAFRRKWTLIGTVVLVIGAGVGVLSAHLARERAERSLTKAYLAAQTAYEDELDAYQKQLQSLEDIEKAKDLRPNHDKSTPLFKEFAETYAGHPLAWQASLRLAQEEMKNKNFDEAIRRLEPILPRTRAFPLVQVKVRETLAGLYAEKGDFSRALSELALVEKIAENPLPQGTLLRKAQFAYLSGDKEGAGKLLAELASGKVGDQFIDPETAVEANTWMDLWDLQP
jgi:predicted negative regulator of RcsB-dependent stress response